MARGKKKETLTPEERLQAALVPESEQPYKVPENWCWVKFGYLAIDIADGPFGSNLKSEHYTQKKEVRIIQLSNIGENGWRDENTKYTTFSHAENISRSIVKPGDLVIAKMMPAGRAIICPNNEAKYVLSSDAVKFVPYSQINSKFLLYAVNSNYFQQQVQENTQGITRARTSIKKLKGYAFALPPLAEQQRIVDRIESLFAKLDEAKQKAQEALDSFETRKAAILHKAFTGELTAQWRKEHGVGMESWSWIPLKKCGSWNGGGTPSMSHPEYWENGTLLWVTSKDMKSDLIEDTLMHTNMLGVENSSATYIEEPAVLFVMRSGILRRIFPVCMVKKPFTVNQDLKALVPTVDINLEYLFWACKANEKQILEKCMKSGTTVESINTAALRDFEIPIARKNEQTEIVRILDDLLAKEQQAKEAAEGVLEQIDLIKKAILARAFRGELGTNGPTEESAVELLKALFEA